VPDEDDQKPDEPKAPDQADEERPPAEGEAQPEQPQADRFRPEAIAARIEQIGEETELDRIARQEEQKLVERKKQSKGKRGLEAAASKRLAKIGEGKVKRPSAAADAYIPEADPLMERARRLRRWIETHRGVFGAVVGVAIVALGGALGSVYWQNRRDAEASALLAKALADEHGQLSDKDDDDDDDTRARQLYPTFKSAADRRSAALAKYREVESKYGGTGAAILARLAEAGLLLDAGDAKGAKAAYEDVRQSPLASADSEVRGRALEGMGFANELLAEADAAQRDKHLDDALGDFKALEQLEVKGLHELGAYHQARVLQAKGDKAKAIDLLKDVYKRVTEPGESHPFSYLEFVVEDRLRALDPTALPPKAAKQPPSGPGGGKLDTSDPRVQELIRQLQQQAQQKGGGAPPPLVPGQHP